MNHPWWQRRVYGISQPTRRRTRWLQGLPAFLVLFASLAIGDEAAKSPVGKPYVNGEDPFVAIEDLNRQAETWAVCAAAYSLAAELLDGQEGGSARSEELNNMGNGAKLAIPMTLLGALTENRSSDDPALAKKFSSIWSYGKVAMKEWPEVQRTAILADLERAQDDEDAVSQWLANLMSTVAVCMKNAESQQMYIDLWRSLATSGIFEPPTD